MNSHVHQQMADGRWNQLSLMEQMANVGSEVGRAIRWREKNDEVTANKAFERALELFELTVQCPANQGRLKEVLRAKEVFCDYFVGDNIYRSEATSLDLYFMQFAYAVRA